jgi:hypothetical protein
MDSALILLCGAPHNRLDVSSVLARSYRRITISNRSSAAVSGNLRMPKSSMMSNGTVVSITMNSLRVPSTTASANSSSNGEVLQFCAGFAPREAPLDKTQWIRVKFAHAVDQLQRVGRLFRAGGCDSVGDHGQGSPFASAASFSSTSCCRPAFNRALATATGTLPGASHVVWNIPISLPNSSSALFANRRSVFCGSWAAGANVESESP